MIVLTAREEPILAYHGDLPDRALASVVVDLETAVAEIATERVGVAVEVPRRTTDLRLREQLAMLRAEVSVSRMSLDAVEHPNRLQRRLGMLGSVRQRFEEFAPRVCQAA